jgi:DNA-binding beta-propeller fold protein YncE
MFKFDQVTGQLTANHYLPGSPSKQQLLSSQKQQTTAGSGGSSNSSRNVSVQPGDNKVLLPAGSGPRHIIFHPRLPVAYVLNELTSTIARFDWDPATGGHLLADFDQQPERIVSMLPAGSSSCSINPQQPANSGACKGQKCLQAGAELVLSSDTKFLYASNRGKCGGINSIVIYAVEPSNGALQALAWEDAGGDINFPRHISLTPDKDNRFLLVANQEGGTLTVLGRDAKTGLLTKVATIPAASADGEARVVEPAFISVIP